ncbi:hypothetical protein B1756_02940 [Natrarchaeobaculum aegyptiacum]|uniref:CheW-like domain-containing protein n=2 Tax=Natrarchaeobaculum aegyptiacum TaxID=745377 RepID=A0A2Z2HYY9_9EURY|nr:hypothetical protein B1756_02940 [Natrarchaeobaculum aegyptiacum]
MTSRPTSGPADESDNSPTGDRWTVLAFTVGADRYCISLSAVDAVVGVTEADPLESAPDPWNAGTVTVDGTPVRVVDLPRVFSAGTVERVDDPALVVLTADAVGSDATGTAAESSSQRYGWLVDDVGVTETVDPATIQPVRTSARVIRGQVVLESGRAMVLDERVMHVRK